MTIVTRHFGALPPRPRWQSLKRGFRMTCPNCGKGRLFGRFLKVNDRCSECGEELFHQRADDAPAYFTILVVGHVVILGLLWTEQAFTLPVWIEGAIWVPAVFILSLWLLPRIKGALIALQWAMHMHGFGRGKDGAEP